MAARRVFLADATTRDELRSRAERSVGPLVFRAAKLLKANRKQLKEWRADPWGYEPSPPQRPLQRCDCERVPRPCPWVGCRYHLYLQVDVTDAGVRIRLNFPDIEPHELPPEQSCLLDIIDAAPWGLDEVEIGRALNLTREAIRLELRAALIRLGG